MDSQESFPSPQSESINSLVFSLFMVQFSHPYVTTRKTIASTIWTFVSKVMSLFNKLSRFVMGLLVTQLVKSLSAMQETPVWFLGWEDPLEKGQATHSSILGLPWWLRWWRIHLQCGRPGFDPRVWKMPWRSAWQSTPVFLPGESPWTEETGGLQSMGSQRVRQDWVTQQSTGHSYVPPLLVLPPTPSHPSRLSLS